MGQRLVLERWDKTKTLPPFERRFEIVCRCFKA